MAEEIEVSFESGGDSAHFIGDRVNNDYYQAAKFTTSNAIICTSASIYLSGTFDGPPSGDMTFRIETDVGSEPSGTLAHANATEVIAYASISEPAWNKCSFTPFALSTGTYWLVVYIPDQATDVCWEWLCDTDGTGVAAYSSDDGANWTVQTNQFVNYVRIYRSTNLFISVHDCSDLEDKMVGG